MKRLFLLVILAAACGGAKVSTETTKPVTTDKSLYDRLGGKAAITAVVDDFVGNIAADSSINGRFASTDIPHLKAELVDQICEATGGPCKYTGKSMPESHAGMKISHAEFAALVADLKKSLDKFKVPEREQGELLSALGGMEGDIVNK